MFFAESLIVLNRNEMLRIIFDVISANGQIIVDQSENYCAEDYNGQTGESHKKTSTP